MIHLIRLPPLSRTIADLAGSEEVQSAHLAEALLYRPKLIMHNSRSRLDKMVIYAASGKW
ncbi:MAG: hypothetical protein FJ031_11700 [Chloroflexi bacterium]|nr:hypothetical protein [Chloroflexota bacterium]